MARAGAILGQTPHAHVGPVPLPALQSLFDGFYCSGLQWYWKADFVNELSEPAIAQHLKFGSELPTMHSAMHLYPINGAVHRKSSTDAAFSYRKSKWAEVIVGVDPSPTNAGKITRWAKDYWQAVHPYAAPGAYVNFMMEEGSARIEATYGENYSKLQQIKSKFDPENLFRVNQNIARKRIDLSLVYTSCLSTKIRVNRNSSRTVAFSCKESWCSKDKPVTKRCEQCGPGHRSR